MDAHTVIGRRRYNLSLGDTPVATRDAQTIRRADRVILPGVGAFGEAMRQIRGYGLEEPIREAVANGHSERVRRDAGRRRMPEMPCGHGQTNKGDPYRPGNAGRQKHSKREPMTAIIDAGYVPVSFLAEEGQLAGPAARLLARCSDIPVYTAGFSIRRGEAQEKVKTDCLCRRRGL